MRLLRLDIRDDSTSLDLHPFLTVVTQIAPIGRSQLLAATRKLSRGETTGIRGLIQTGAELVELGPWIADPLEGHATAACVLVPVDVVGDAAASNVVRYEVERWANQSSIDAARVEELRFSLDMSAAPRLAALQRRQTEASEKVTQAGKARVTAVVQALDAVQAEEQLVSDLDLAREQVAKRWDAHLAEQERQSGHLEALALRISQAEQEVKDAEADLAEATKAAEPAVLEKAEDARLEELAHKIGRRHRLRRQKLSEDEQAEMSRLLNKVGVASWTEYAVYRLSPSASAEMIEARERAAERLDEVRQACESVTRECGDDAVVAALNAEEAAIRQAARPFFSVTMPADLGPVLRRQAEERENPEWRRAINGLRDVLSSVSLNPPPMATDAELVDWAEAWVAAELGDRSSAADVPLPAPPAGSDHPDRVAKAIRVHDAAMKKIHGAERTAARSAIGARALATNEGQLRPGVFTGNPDDLIERVVVAAEQVHRELDGSTPLVVVGDLLGLSSEDAAVVMKALGEVSRKVQIVLMTENHHIVRWMESVGLENGFTSRLRPSPELATSR